MGLGIRAKHLGLAVNAVVCSILHILGVLPHGCVAGVVTQRQIRVLVIKSGRRDVYGR